jgi:outer membrane autotransporter protein
MDIKKLMGTLHATNSCRLHNTNLMNPLKIHLLPALVFFGIIGLTLPASAQNTNSDTNGYIPGFMQQGATGFTQNQVNLDSALWSGVWNKLATTENFVAIQKALQAGTLKRDQNTFLLSGTGVSQELINAYNTFQKLSFVIWGFIEDPGVTKIAATYQQFLNQLSPGLYTALPSMLFNSANLQNTQIQQRFWAARTGRSANDSLPPLYEGDKSVALSGKKVVAPIAESDQKWVTFVDGNGMWSQAQGVNNLPGYNTYAGGVQIGATYEFLKGLNAGPYVGYQGTKVNFNGSNSGGSSATDNSVRFGLQGEYQKGGWYTDGIVGGAYNSVAVSHGISIPGNDTLLASVISSLGRFNSMANGNVAGGEFDSMLGTGYEFKAGKLIFGPSTSLQYTHLYLGGTQEAGAGVLNQNIGSQNASSMLYTLGGQASYTFDLTASIKLQPFASLAWQHEFLQNSYNLTSSILGKSYNYQTTNAGRDQYIAGMGGNLVLTKSLSAYAICNLINSDARVFSQAVSGGINFKF